MALHNFGPENQPVYNRFAVSKVTVSTVAQLSAQACGLCLLHAAPANTQRITLGGDNTVTDGVGFTLAAGESTPWIPIDNLNRIWVIAASGSQTLEIIYL